MPVELLHKERFKLDADNSAIRKLRDNMSWTDNKITMEGCHL